MRTLLRSHMGFRVLQFSALGVLALIGVALWAWRTGSLDSVNSLSVTLLRNDLELIPIGAAQELPFRIVARGRDAVTVIGFSQA